MWTFLGDVVSDSPEPAVATKLEENIISQILAPPRTKKSSTKIIFKHEIIPF
jgi:hypothetical protein